MKRFIAGVAFALLAGVANADQITVSWDIMAGATSYTLYKSIDTGATWTRVVDSPQPTVVVVCEGDRLVLFKVSATNATGESKLEGRGAWYNGKWFSTPRNLRLD